MKKFKGITMLIVMLIVVFTIFLTSITAYSYSLTGYKWKSSTITYYYDNYNTSRGKTYFEIGAKGWDGTDVKFSKSGNPASYNIYCGETSNSKVSWDGLSSVTCSGSYYTKITLTLNMSATNTWNNDGALKSVVVHEFGHCLGLNHVSGKVIMNPYTFGNNSRYETYGLTTIQTDDRNGANALY